MCPWNKLVFKAVCVLPHVSWLANINIPMYNICTQWLSRRGKDLITWSQIIDLLQTRILGLLYPKQTQLHADVSHLVLPESQDLVLQSFENFTKP